MNLETLQQKLPHVSLTELYELPEVSAIYYVVVNETVFRGRQALPKEDAKGVLAGKTPRQIASLLTM